MASNSPKKRGDLVGDSGDVTVEVSYTNPSPEVLWERLKGVLEEKTLPNWNANDAWTETMTAIFREIGQSFGFETRDRFVGSEYMGLDQIWYIHHRKLASFISLAFEVENTDKLGDLIDDEVQKLLDIKARLKVVCYYPSTRKVESDLSEIAKSVAAQGLKFDAERFLVMHILLGGPLGKDAYAEKLRTTMYEISHDGRITTIGSGDIRYRK